MAFPFLFLVAIISALVVFDIRVHIRFPVIRIESPGLIIPLRPVGVDGTSRSAVTLLGRANKRVEPFADGHPRAARGFPRSCADFWTETSEIPRTV